jgi:Flp pilus assembly protein TadG
MRRRRRRTWRERGQSLAEFAIIFPVVAWVVFGLVDMARAMQSYLTIQAAARDGVRYAVTGRIDCTGVAIQNRDNCIVQQVKNRVKDLNNASTITITYRSWDYPNYSDPPTESNAGEQCDAVEVEVNYSYQPMTPILKSIVSAVPMKAKERLVNEPYGTCW